MCPSRKPQSPLVLTDQSPSLRTSNLISSLEMQSLNYHIGGSSHITKILGDILQPTAPSFPGTKTTMGNLMEHIIEAGKLGYFLFLFLRRELDETNVFEWAKLWVNIVNYSFGAARASISINIDS